MHEIIIFPSRESFELFWVFTAPFEHARIKGRSRFSICLINFCCLYIQWLLNVDFMSHKAGFLDERRIRKEESARNSPRSESTTTTIMLWR